MPSHTIPSALIKLFYSDGAPWNWPDWQAITAVRHGLFPTDDSLLPKGFTRRDVLDITSYFDQYNALPTEDDKIKFTSQRKGAQVPGRVKWRDWITAGWKSWKIHSRITDVLTEDGLHPLTIMINTNNLDTWPPGDLYIPLIVDAVGRDLFGEPSFDTSGRLALPYRQLTQHLIQRTWINIHKQTNRNKNRLVTLEAAATKAFNDLDRDQLTKAKISVAIRSVSRWRNLAQLYATDSVTEKIEGMDNELKRLMSALGAKVQAAAPTSPTPGQPMFKVSNQALSSLATKENVADIINLYHEFFSANQEGEATSVTDEDQPTIKFGTAVEGADPGVEMEMAMAPEALASNLGFRNELPLLFNSFRHKGGLSPWSHPALFDDPESQDNLEPLRLFWHQLAGVHAIVRISFQPTPSSGRCNGVLIADEVGLGKTFQASTIVVFLADLVFRQTENLPLPPIIKANPYLGEISTIPSHPHLIVVPGTLLSQWEVELKTLIKPHTFDIFLYGSGKSLHESFWSPGGPFHSSRLPMANRIIIASQTALQQDFNAVFFSRANGPKRLPWTLPEKVPHSARTISNTLYGQRYLTITVDEGHSFRNTGPRHSAILLLLDRAELRLILTATPLQTSNKDVSAMGRLTGVAHFFTEEAHREEKNDNANLRRVKKELPEDYDPLNDDEDDPIKSCQVSIAQRMQAQFQGRIIRRTIDSKDWQGQLLLNLPPYMAVHAVLNLTEREIAIIATKAEEVKDQVSTANGTSKLTTRSFYIEYRMSVGFARESPDTPIPSFATLQDWEAVKSTKMDTCAQICRHLLTRDDAPPINFEEGKAIFPPMPPSPQGGKKPLQEKKILIYQEFTSLGPLLLNVLSLYGIQALSIDGQMTFENRAATVSKFRSQPDARVLIFSSVGSTGLNLSCANTIIFLDQPWSAQDERQIRGRAHRQPQKKEVLLIHLLANDTADVVLSGMARGKRDMLEAFLSKESNQSK
ncbi:hypothetical protein BYT27DRAFT_7097080 [Phlegmacium glaucopus]|nr:hypothetical protein BYT27DRAFT_7097080 [Phlegmacium glaucopus]